MIPETPERGEVVEEGETGVPPAQTNQRGERSEPASKKTEQPRKKKQEVTMRKRYYFLSSSEEVEPSKDEEEEKRRIALKGKSKASTVRAHDGNSNYFIRTNRRYS